MAFTKNIYSFSLDIKRKTGTRVLSVEGDTANQFIVFLTDDGKPIDLTGLYVRAVFRRSDGRTILQSESDEDGPVTKVAESGKVIIPVKNSAYRDGDNYMEIQILDGDPDSGDVLSTSAYMLIRARNCLLTDEATIGSVEFPVLQGLIDALRDIHVIINIVEPNVPASGSMVLADGVYTLTINIPKQTGRISLIEYGESTYTDIAAEYNKGMLPVCLDILGTGDILFYYLAFLDRAEQVAKFTVVDPDGDSITVVTASYDEDEYGNTLWEKVTKNVGDEVLIARYNVTTSDEIYEAFTEGKLVVCRRSLNNGEAHLGLLWNCDFSGATFYAPNAYGIWKYTVALSQWSESQHLSSVFFAVYDVTSFEEIYNAYIANVPVYCEKDNRVYILERSNIQSATSGTFTFTHTIADLTELLVCNGSSGTPSHPGDTWLWSQYAYDLQFKLVAGDGITIVNNPRDEDYEEHYFKDNGQTISADVMVGATASANGSAGMVPAPLSADREKYLRGDGTWATPSGGGGPSLPVGSDDVEVENLIESSLTRIDDGDTLTFAIAQINALIDAIGDKLDDDGDANDVTVQRNATYSFADIPVTAIRLQELVDRLAGWYSEINSKQHTLTAGTGINISNNVISATGGADIFIATPYTTPFADIKTAWTAGKVVMCKYGAQGTHNAWYILTDLTESAAASAAMFTAVTSAGNLLTLKALESNGSTTWTNSSVTYRSASAQDTIDAGKQDAATEVTNAASGAVSQACEDNTIYTFTGALTSLTLTEASGAREYIVIFTTGSTAPTVTPPTGVVFPDGTNTFTAEANKRYEISVRDGFALVGSWAVSA